MLSSKSVRSHPPSYYYFHIGPLMIENDPNTRLHITDCPHLFSEVYLLLAEKIWMTKILLFDDRSISLFLGGQSRPSPDNWARDPTIQSLTVRGPICFDFFFSRFLTKYYSGTLISTLCVIRSLEPWCFVSISFEGKFVHTAALCV